MIELPKFPGNPAAPVTSGDGITSVASHLQVEDHEVDLRAINPNRYLLVKLQQL